MSDPTTQSNYAEIATTDLELSWRIDFQEKKVSGYAVHILKVLNDGVDKVIFDTSELNIESTEVAIGKGPWEPSKFSVGDPHVVMGSALSIMFPNPVNTETDVKVKVSYSTTTNSKALQWLDPQQTQGKVHPYLFSQCQPIYARDLVPIQDTPSVKIRYIAQVTSVLPVLMSAIRISPPAEAFPRGEEVGKKEVTYEYKQPVPIPSYLLAIASGNVVYRAFEVPQGKPWTSGVWAEPELIDAAWQEFNEDTPKFLAAEEAITTDYKFGVYDLLVLPPSFPYGGMENACLTFVTPTLLTGDRTLVDVVVHEITHSWFGNGITHADASHFWLNEGWTTYIERLLQQILHTPAHRGFSFLIGRKLLDDDLKLFQDRDTPKYQRLQIAFTKGENPDDAYSSVPYEKGGNFILHLERALGGLDVFLPYVKDYVATFMGQSITTQQWKDHLFAYFRNQPEAIRALDEISWDEWFFGEGLELPVEMDYDTTLASESYALAQRWDESRDTEVSQTDFDASDLKNMDANQIIVFLERLQTDFQPLPKAHIDHLGIIYGFSKTNNAEIRFRFYQVALLKPDSEAAQAYAQEAVDWVVGNDETGVVKGRMKFCRPVFRAVFAANSSLAIATYEEYKNEFHPIARNLIEGVSAV
ncbi:hypothetical protein PAXRUDRAFT_142351 [Paxillus rubicundulus Ve08.2h10]|uniref:Peptidase M1 leukotriene A4 hydrolase/aminopeptidase C-terminal domain-containing protein n=1 Tax=Paxillus rubicundulus Ve08.2h10 TaxID=930991 RepID=A0A0D0E2B7_9AGAM|nr:hypothetical protein PAXRUDRAFT_142351 [Paxillus rubicundulus Ve08.2h10]